MPIISRKQYAELCGDIVQKINEWIKRGKISTFPDNIKLIDTDNAINSTFMSDRRRFNAMGPYDGHVPDNSNIDTKISKTVIKSPKSVKEKAKSVTKIPEKVTKSVPKKAEKVPLKQTGRQHKIVPTTEPREIRIVEKKIAMQTARDDKRVDQDMQKKALEIENLELAKQQKLLQLNKSAGNLMPVDLVRGVLKRHADSFLKNFERGIETQITIMVNIMGGGDPVLNTRFLGEAKELLSKNIVTAGKQAEEEIKILVSDYSQTLVRGQKKA